MKVFSAKKFIDVEGYDKYLKCKIWVDTCDLEPVGDYNIIRDVDVDCGFNIDIPICDEWCVEINGNPRSFNHMATEIHQNAVEHGWYNPEPSFPETIAMCHSELSEALMSYRDDEPLFAYNRIYPDGIAVEMADCLIRILDWFGYMNLDVDKIVQLKMRYNATRPYRHGDKKC